MRHRLLPTIPADPQRGDIVGDRVFDGRRWLPVAAPADPSCQGPGGRDGRDGRHGFDGRNGADGAPGLPGADGAPGKQGPRGKRGAAGEVVSYTRIRRETSPDGLPVTATFDSVTGKGQAVYVSGNGTVDLAKADAFATSNPVGLAKDTYSPGVGEYAVSGPLTLDDWTGATGSPLLSPGATYFVNPTIAGMLTTTCPEASGQYVLIVGSALSQTTLLIEIHRSYRIG